MAALQDTHKLNSKNSKTTILYIDDDPGNRTLINRLLTIYDIDVVEATNGLEGISIARTTFPNLILMDINMPGLDGHETTTRMRSIPDLKGIPIVAVTARTTKGERELALAAGCDGYIPKPIDVDTFPQQVIAYLDGYRDTISQDERQRYLGDYSQKLVEHLETKIIELEEANKKLQKIDKLKSDFITLAAHELRTPLTLVYGYTRLLEMTANHCSQQNSETNSMKDLAVEIANSVSRLNEVVNDLLNISLIEANEMQLMHQPINLDKIIQAALTELNPKKNGRNLNITLKELDALPTVMGDPQRLQQVFWNLLSNAIKYTPDGGSIIVTGQVTTLNSSQSMDHQSPHENNDIQNSPAQDPQATTPGVIISVKDTGIGLDPSEQKEIFGHFYIVSDTSHHSSSKTAFGGGGMGLGLPIARGILEAHGGQIWVESKAQSPSLAGQKAEETPGSTFYVFLPQKNSPH